MTNQTNLKLIKLKNARLDIKKSSLKNEIENYTTFSKIGKSTVRASFNISALLHEIATIENEILALS